MVAELNTATFDEFVNSSDVPVVVDFWAEWCGPCRALGPVVEQVSMALMGKVKFAKVDIDANPELVLPHDIKTIPALIAFHEGKSLGRISLTGLGFTENNVKEAVHNYLEFKGVSI